MRSRSPERASNGFRRSCGRFERGDLSTEYRSGMASRNSDLYRAKALERFASPDNLERLVPAVQRRDWMPVLVTGVLFALGLAWAVAGCAPPDVAGRGGVPKPRRGVRGPAAR